MYLPGSLQVTVVLVLCIVWGYYLSFTNVELQSVPGSFTCL